MNKIDNNTNSISTSTEDLVLNTVISLYKDNKNITTATVKYSIKRPIPFPLIISTVKYWNELSTDEKNNLLISKFGQDALTKREQLLNGNNNSNSVSLSNDSNVVNDSITTSSNKDASSNLEIKFVSDDDFLNLNNKEQLLYLKRLLETVLKRK